MEYSKANVKRPLKSPEKVELAPKRYLVASNIKQITNIQLMDLDSHCLENIFSYLEVKDLLNVADTSNALKPAIGVAYRRKYETKTANVILGIQQYISPEPICEAFNNIQINDLKTTFQLIRNFGYLMKVLHVAYDQDLDRCGEVYSYVNRYTNQHLTDLYFNNQLPNYMAETMFQYPFSNVARISFDNTYLFGDITDFNKWFPNIRGMTFHNAILTDPKCIETNFPTLDYLKVSKSTPTDSIENAFRLNPQLQELDLYSDFSGILLELASESLPNLEWLSVRWEKDENEEYEMLSNINGGNIYFNKLKTLNIYLGSENDDDNPFPKIPITFGPVTELYLHTLCGLDNEHFIDFFLYNSMIERLFLFSQSYNIVLTPTLREIFLGYVCTELLDAVQFMDSNRSIQRLGCAQFVDVDNSILKSDTDTYELEYEFVKDLTITVLKRTTN